MTIEAIITLALAVLALALKPGPGMMMVMSRTIGQGMSACFTFILGFLLVTLFYVVIVLVGLQSADFDIVFLSIFIKTLAAVYLIWLGIKGLQHTDLEYGPPDAAGHGFIDNVTGAMILTASNPLVIVFYAGILPSLVDVNTMTLNDMVIIASVVLFIEGIIPVFYCLPLALFRKKIPISFLKGLRIFSSIMIIFVGLYIGYTALPSKDIVSVFG